MTEFANGQHEQLLGHPFYAKARLALEQGRVNLDPDDLDFDYSGNQKKRIYSSMDPAYTAAGFLVEMVETAGLVPAGSLRADVRLVDGREQFDLIRTQAVLTERVDNVSVY